MNIRMMPIRGTFEKFRRLVHDLARDLEKNVELTIEGADTELDKTVIEQLGDPLMHLIRNSMDHGIEPAEVRAASGKPLTATIHLAARHSGASVLVTVTDDGRGIDGDAVRRRAVERGLISQEAQLTESQIYALIFEPGFSTAAQVTDVSGRGVGMDVVRQRVESLRGAVEVSSKPGEGTSVTLRLPLTMAIIDGLLVGVGDACFVLPLSITLECIELTRQDIARANGKHIANVRGELVPYIRLREHFHMRSRSARDRADHAGRNRGRPVRICGGPGAGQLPDGDQEPGAVLPPGSGGFRRHHSGQRNRGPDPRPRTHDSERHARRGARQRRPSVDGAWRPSGKHCGLSSPCGQRQRWTERQCTCVGESTRNVSCSSSRGTATP